jgi:hypothetical protein
MKMCGGCNWLIIVYRIFPLLGNGSVNTFQQHKRSTIEGHPLIGNGLVNMLFWTTEDGVFRGVRAKWL